MPNARDPSKSVVNDDKYDNLVHVSWTTGIMAAISASAITIISDDPVSQILVRSKSS